MACLSHAHAYVCATNVYASDRRTDADRVLPQMSADIDSSLEPEVVLGRLFTERQQREFAIQVFDEAIRIAHAQNPRTWSVTLTREFARLNTGRVEVFALFPGMLHFVVDRNLLSNSLQRGNERDVYASIPRSKSIDLGVEEARERLPQIRSAWHAAIRVGADSARAASYRRYHSDAFLSYLKSLGAADLPSPEWSHAPVATLDHVGLEGLRERFLRRVHDFGTFSDRQSVYWNEERAYKLELAELNRRTLNDELLSRAHSESAADEIMGAVLRVLTTPLKAADNKPQNLASWRYFDFVRKLSREEKNRFVPAFATLLRGSGPSPTRVAEFVQVVFPMMKRIIGGNPYAPSRIFPTLFLMLQSPGTDIAVRTDMFELASKRLTGRNALQQQPLSQEEYEDVLELSMSLREQLEIWGWMPTDMIDVHSFLWIATPERDEPVDAELT